MSKVMENSKWITITSPDGEIDKGAKINPWDGGVSLEGQRSAIVAGTGLPLFRKIFTINKNELDKCCIHATALGIYDLYINGNRVGNDELKPGWSDFKKRALYYSYDVTDLLNDGENCVLAQVASGWACGRIALGNYPFAQMSFMADIIVENKDGSILSIPTDESWSAGWGGPVLNADIWDGEFYNANADLPGKISSVDYCTCSWGKAEILSGCDIEVTPHIGSTIKVRDFLDMQPVTATVYDSVIDNGTDFGKISTIEADCLNGPFVLKKGCTLVYDFGQNMVGWENFTVKGGKNTLITIRFAEMLNDSGSLSRGNDGPEGSIYTANYRSAKAKGHYVIRGDENGESYRPTFTFYGFRYIEVSATEDITILSFKADVVGNDNREVGYFECSDKDVNKLYSNVLWGQRGNYLSVPTDCPQRDERLGWTGDTQIFCGAAIYNADVCGFFHKWLQDARDGQSPAGKYSDVIPRSRVAGEGNAAWSDAPIIVGYTVYKMYGDKSILQENFDSFEKYMDFLQTTDCKGPHPCYGDWLAYDPTPREYISVTYYAYDALLMIEISKALSENEGDIYSQKAAKYQEVYNNVKAYFQSVYLDENNKLTQKTQTGYLLALKMHLLPKEEEAEAIENLRQKIIDNDYKLSTGFIGTGALNQTLSDVGCTDLAYSLLLQTQNPSWLYSVYQGATTIWERWNSYTLDKGFGDVGMNSFNHYAYGVVFEWCFKYMAGIEADILNPGFKHIILQPMPDYRTFIPQGQPRITWVKAGFESASGQIDVAWDISKDYFDYSCSVPENTYATFVIPAELKDYESISINGKEYDKGLAQIDLQPGSYSIIIK